MSISFRAE